MWTSATYQFQSSSYRWESGDMVTLPSDAWVGDVMPTAHYGYAVVVAHSLNLAKMNSVDPRLTGESCSVTWTLSTLGPAKTCVRVMVVEEGIILRYAKEQCVALGASLVSIQTVDKLGQICVLIDDTRKFREWESTANTM
ncbi:hypothetical protein NP493_989g00020 [Ridgeia piscesae]|uniref:Uncharacterized protein n=1 Tax=Ridgeia piscesae TaxID=27915 RepID=A0AAD9KJ58_RIDPI|nr:hypothetical protein NP493_989g00020 [Ridgeia piscesae]